MSWATPLGFIGLIAIGGLILIYLLKPNYQNKVVSSTYIWKLSLKYKKRRIPVSRLRNILLIIFQVLILVSCALLLAQPIIKSDKGIYKDEKVVIIDASASMLATNDSQTRFARAVAQVKELATDITSKDNGKITVILAGQEAEVLVHRADAESVTEVYSALDDLVKPGGFACTYGKADIAGAITLAEEVLVENGDAEVMLYTGTKYVDSGKITVKDVSDVNEFNVAILNCTAELIDNYYSFTVEVACYNRDMAVSVSCQVTGANDKNISASMTRTVHCSDDKTQKVVFDTFNAAAESIKVYKFECVNVSVNLSVEDSLECDNKFTLYGGMKQPLKMQYYSTKPNIFHDTTGLALEKALRARWDIDMRTVSSNQSPQREGYDFYIYEHRMPSVLPTDGVVLLIDPDRAPEGSDLIMGGKKVEDSDGLALAAKKAHPVLSNVRPEISSVTRYPKIDAYNGYEELMSCGDDPMLLVRNERNSKICVLAVDLNYSTLGVNDFVLLFLNILNYYMPSTLTQYVFDVNESVNLNARGPELTLNSSADSTLNIVFTEFPSEYALLIPGEYSLTQQLISEKYVVENFFVKIASSESYISRVDESDTLLKMQNSAPPVINDRDLVMYFAIALLVLLFGEWLLQSRENM